MAEGRVLLEAVCFTNLDDCKIEEWPNYFPEVPRIGDRVQAISGKSLVVIAITWVAVPIRGTHKRECTLRIELHR